MEINSLNGSYQMKGMLADDFPELPLVESDRSLKINPTSGETVVAA